MRRSKAVALAAAIPWLVTTSSLAAPWHAASPDPWAVVRGMTVSCRGAGLSWGSEEMAGTLDRLAELGVNWVAIHPYGGIRGDGTVGQSRIDRLLEDPVWLTRAIEMAHERGLKILVKPHIAYWGSAFPWRGAIAFESGAQWNRFFATYTEWIVRVAEASRGADAFAVGTELDGTESHEASWRGIIAAVRAATDAPLTYSANWNRYRALAFWDALDVIGVQAYFPLVDHEGPATEAEVRAGWARVIAELEEFSRAAGKRVVLGELGYNRSQRAAVEPWAYASDSSPEGEALQSLCLDAALDAVAGSDALVGAFLWKWFPGESERGNFLKSTPAMRRVIARHWANAAPAR